MTVFPTLTSVGLRAGLVVLTLRSPSIDKQETQTMTNAASTASVAANSTSMGVWRTVLNTYEGSEHLPEQSRQAILKSVLPPHFAFSVTGKAAGDKHTYTLVSGALEALVVKRPEVVEVLDRLLDVTNDLTSGGDAGKAMRRFADITPMHLSPKSYYFAVIHLAAKMGKVPVPVTSEGKPLVDVTTGAKDIYDGFINLGKLTQTGYNALIAVVEAAVAAHDPAAPDLTSVPRAKKSTQADDFGVDIKPPSRRQALLERLGRGGGASAPSPAAAQGRGVKAATAAFVIATVKVREADGSVGVFTGDPAGLYGAIEGAKEENLPFALFTAEGVGIPIAERDAAIEALRATLPPSEEDFFA
jgi:hypothetical protein